MRYLTSLLLAFALAACGKAGMPSDPLHAVAVQTCKNTIESRATNRKSLDYLSVDVTPAAPGKLNVAIDLSAKNEIGMASRLQARCTVSADGKSLLDIAVKDVR